MKKIMFAFIIAIILMIGQLSFAAEVKRPGLQYRGLFPPKSVTDKDADFTNGIAPAIADQIRNQGAGIHAGPNGQLVIPRNNFKSCAAINSSSYNLLIEFRIALLPGMIDAQQLISSTGTYIPGYEPISVIVQKKGKDGYSLQEFSAQPGEWDVTIYRMTSNGKKLVKNDRLHVDQFSGRHKIGAKEYHSAYHY